jgi:aspartyl/asparaginyl beta-hydroxylase (cupin superfamily)
MAESAYQKRYRETHKEERSAYHKCWVEGHKEELREYNKKRESEKRREYRKRYEEKYPEKYAAHIAVTRALRQGKLTKPDCCDECSQEGYVESHHDDYSKPLEVRWLCKKCHAVLNET